MPHQLSPLGTRSSLWLGAEVGGKQAVGRGGPFAGC